MGTFVHGVEKLLMNLPVIAIVLLCIVAYLIVGTAVMLVWIKRLD